MKKTTFLGFALLICCFTNCSTEEFANETPNQLSGIPETRNVINKTYSSLGVSYDASNEYLGIDAAKYKVIDIDAYLKDYPNSLLENNTTAGTVDIFSGSNAVEYTREITNKMKLHTAGDMDFKVFSGSSHLKFETDLYTKNTYSSKYSYARADVVKRVKRLYLRDNPEVLKNYLYPEFLEDLENKTPMQFIAMYGTHVLTDITLGGRLQFNYRSEIYDVSEKSQKRIFVESGVKTKILGIGADITQSYDREDIKTQATVNRNWTLKVNYVGGTNSGTSMTLTNDGQIASQQFNISQWESSVTADNSIIINLEWNKTYPIYEFIEDPIKREQIKQAYEEYLKLETLEVIEVKPVYRLYTSTYTTNCYLSSSFDEVVYYTTNHNYYYSSKQDALGYVFATQQPGTVPLYRIHDDWAHKSFYTSSLTEANTFKSRWGYRWETGTTGSNILGYVYKTNQSNLQTVPFYRLVHHASLTKFYTTSLIEADRYRNNWDWVFDSGTSGTYIHGYLLPLGQY